MRKQNGEWRFTTEGIYPARTDREMKPGARGLTHREGPFCVFLCGVRPSHIRLRVNNRWVGCREGEKMMGPLDICTWRWAPTRTGTTRLCVSDVSLSRLSETCLIQRVLFRSATCMCDSCTCALNASRSHITTHTRGLRIKHLWVGPQPTRSRSLTNNLYTLQEIYYDSK